MPPLHLSSGGTEPPSVGRQPGIPFLTAFSSPGDGRAIPSGLVDVSHHELAQTGPAPSQPPPQPPPASGGLDGAGLEAAAAAVQAEARAYAEQQVAKLRWIREPFLSHTEPHDGVVVHGHTMPLTAVWPFTKYVSVHFAVVAPAVPQGARSAKSCVFALCASASVISF